MFLWVIVPSNWYLFLTLVSVFPLGRDRRLELGVNITKVT